jgi:hypothetical protein
VNYADGTKVERERELGSGRWRQDMRLQETDRAFKSACVSRLSSTERLERAGRAGPAQLCSFYSTRPPEYGTHVQVARPGLRWLNACMIVRWNGLATGYAVPLMLPVCWQA